MNKRFATNRNASCRETSSSHPPRLTNHRNQKSPLRGRHDEPRRLSAHLPEQTHRARDSRLLVDKLGAAARARHGRRASVDGHERRRAHHEGVARVVVQLHLVPGRSFARLQHLLRLLRNLHGRVELEQTPAKARGGVVVLQLEEERHRRPQRQRQVDRLQLRVREVRRQLGSARRVFLVLLALHLHAQRARVLARDGDELARLVNLPPRIHEEHARRVDDPLEQLQSFRKLPLRRGFVRQLQSLLQKREARGERGRRDRAGRVVRGPTATERRRQARAAGDGAEPSVRREGGVHEMLAQRREVADAELPVQELHGAVEVSGGGVLARDGGLLRPLARRRDPSGGRHENLRDGVVHAVVGALRRRRELQVLHVPARVRAVVRVRAGLLLLGREARGGERVLLLLSLLVAAQVQVEVVAPAGAGALQVLVGESGVVARRHVPRQHALEEPLRDREQRPVVLPHEGGREGQELADVGVHRRDGNARVGQDAGEPLGVRRQAVRRRREVRQRVVPRLLENLAPLAHVPSVQRVVELPHDVRAHLRDLEHLRQLLSVPGDQVQEGETLEVFRFLIRKLDNLVVALAKRLDAELVPSLLLVELLRGRERNLDVAALKREGETRALVLDEMQRHLREALLLQVRDDALPAERAALDHGQNLIVLALDERQLEHVLAGVDLDLAVAPVAVQAVQNVAENLGEVDGHVQRADDPGVAVGQRVLDVVERGVDEHPGVVPGAALNPDGLVHGAGVPELAVGDHDGVLREHRHQRHVGAPHHVLDLRRRELRHRRSLLHVVQHHLVLGAAQQSTGAGVEDGVRLRVGGRALLRHLVAQILDQDRVRGFIQHGESVARHENRAAPRPAPRVRGDLAARVGGVLG
mmetsp:Transcript_11421/g.47886  ORF Transcript_11421/g.47886 Transcript_11421/m.47886 type:complete len:872 (-) Transcript_11421:1298-3913(-)